MADSWKSRLAEPRSLAAVLGVVAMLAGGAWGAIAWASTRVSEEEAARVHEQIRTEAAEERKVIRAEHTAEIRRTTDEIKKVMEDQHKETREDLKYMQRQLNAIYRDKKNGDHE